MIQDIKELILDWKEMEADLAKDNPLMSNGISFARVGLESLLERHGHSRPRTIDSPRSLESLEIDEAIDRCRIIYNLPKQQKL